MHIESKAEPNKCLMCEIYSVCLKHSSEGCKEDKKATFDEVKDVAKENYGIEFL